MFALLACLELFSVDARADDSSVGGALASWGAVPIASDDDRADGSLHLWGQLQTFATILDQDVSEQADPATYGDPEAEPGFALYRARLGIDGFIGLGDRTCCGQVDYAISFGLGAPYDALTPTGSTSLQLVDGLVRWAMPTGVGVSSVAAGVQRVPFSREAMISSANLVFLERAVGAAWVAPSYDLGATLSQSVSLTDDPAGPQILVRAGAYNGNGTLFGDIDQGLRTAVRGELIAGDTYRTWSPELDPALGIGGGLMLNRQLALSDTAIDVDFLGRIK
jgi:hypothetical protein